MFLFGLAIFGSCCWRIFAVKVTLSEKYNVRMAADTSILNRQLEQNASVVHAAHDDKIKRLKNHTGMDGSAPIGLKPERSMSSGFVSLQQPSKDFYNVESNANIRSPRAVTDEPRKCYPGYFFDGNTCVCDYSLDGLERCDQGRFVFLKEGYWAGMVDSDLVTHACPRGYCVCNRNASGKGCFYDYEKPDEICLAGRERLLCGHCKDGLAVGLRFYTCQDCRGTGWFLFLSLLVVVIVALVLIYLNVGIPADVRGILFYVQVLPYFFPQNDEIGDFVNVVTGIIDLGRPSDYPFNTCAVPNLGNLDAIALNYATPVLVLIILVVLYMCRGSIHLKRPRPFQCFFVLLVLMYKYLAETSFLLLHCVDVGNKNVFYYDGSIECYTGRHLIYAVIALIVIILFVASPVIFIFFAMRRMCCSRFRLPQEVQDVIGHGLRYIDLSIERLRCQHCKHRSPRTCYEENFIDDKRYWWAVDMLRRVALVAIFIYFNYWENKVVALSIASLFILCIHCLAQPYNNVDSKWANSIETLYLFALALIGPVQTLDNKLVRQGITIFILVVTYAGGLFYFSYKVWGFCRSCSTRQASESAGGSSTRNDLGEVSESVEDVPLKGGARFPHRVVENSASLS